MVKSTYEIDWHDDASATVKWATTEGVIRCHVSIPQKHPDFRSSHDRTELALQQAQRALRLILTEDRERS